MMQRWQEQGLCYSLASFLHKSTKSERSCWAVHMQVFKDGGFHSCCLRVKVAQRTLFFVPRPDELKDDGELANLEEEAARDPSKKIELLRYVHVRPAAAAAKNSLLLMNLYCRLVTEF